MRVTDLFHGEKFTEGTPESPMEHTKDILDRMEGRWIMIAKRDKRIIIALSILVFVLTVGLIFQGLKSNVVVHVLETDNVTGQVRNMGVVQETQYIPQEAQVKYFLSQFIANTREIPLDPVVYKQHWNTAYAFLTKAAAAKMNAEVQAENIAQYFGKKTVQVNITSILKIEGGNSYQIRWNEENFAIGSGTKKTIPMTGIFTVTFIPVKDEETLKINPLGIYFSDFNWSKESTGAATEK